MSRYRDRVLPHLINRACATGAAEALRARACAPLAGRIVEIGFGSGLSVRHLPDAVTRVDAVDPSEVAWHLAADRVACASMPITKSGRDAQDLPFEDDTFDSALSAWTLCTVPDAVKALREIHRVLKPGGRFCFVEHGLAPDQKVQAWQRRLEPVQRRVAGGCHLTRRVSDQLREAGFEITTAEIFYESGVPRVLGATTLGSAVCP